MTLTGCQVLLRNTVRAVHLTNFSTSSFMHADRTITTQQKIQHQDASSVRAAIVVHNGAKLKQ